MKFGIIGTTPHASAITRLLATHGEDVNVSDPTDPARAERLSRELGIVPSSPYKQALSSDVLVMAMTWPELEQTLRQLGPLTDEVVVDAIVPDGDEVSSGGDIVSGAETLAHKLDNRHIVEAFVEPNIGPGSTIALCSDDPEARALIAQVIRECGCTPRDLGPLSSAQQMEQNGAG